MMQAAGSGLLLRIVLKICKKRDGRKLELYVWAHTASGSVPSWDNMKIAVSCSLLG